MKSFTRAVAFSVLFVNTVASNCFAAPAPPPPKEPNCQAVYSACTKAGYIYGDAKEGNGLYKDCVGPLVTGTTPPKPAPQGVTFPSQVSAQAQICHQHHPKWGVAK